MLSPDVGRLRSNLVAADRAVPIEGAGVIEIHLAHSSDRGQSGYKDGNLLATQFAATLRARPIVAILNRCESPFAYQFSRK
jgi:hypothetical protein